MSDDQVEDPTSDLMRKSVSELERLRASGAYIPPAKLKQLLANIKVSEGSEEYQKLQWERLKKSINGLVNKVTRKNIREIVLDLFNLNLVRGRGALVKSIMKSQEVSQEHSSVYACLVCVLNSKIPEIGELLVTRLIVHLKRNLRRKRKESSASELSFIAQLTNFQVSHEILVLEVLYELLEKPTDDSVELAAGLIVECGAYLQENSKVACNAIFERFRSIITEGIVDGRVQLILEKAFLSRRDDFKDHPTVDDDLDLVEEEDKITHTIDFTAELDPKEAIDTFQYDKDYKTNEEKYAKLRREILGDDDESASENESTKGTLENGDENEEEEFSVSESEEENDENDNDEGNQQVKEQIKDLTEQELTNFQKNVYLTVMGSMGPEEAVHKLLKLEAIDPIRNEFMVVDMLVKCCAQEKSYSKFYGLIGEGLILVNRRWEDAFNQVFKENYATCHRFETTLLRNIGTFWGHMFASDKMGWEVMKIIELTEEETNSAQRILLKFILLRLRSELGMAELLRRIGESYISPYLGGLFPRTGADHLRFSINYFTAIGLGRLTEEMREILKNSPVAESAERGRLRERSESVSRSGSSSSSYSGSSYSSSSYSRSRSASDSRSPSRESNLPQEKRKRSEGESASPPHVKRPHASTEDQSSDSHRGQNILRSNRGRYVATNANTIPLGPKKAHRKI
ncbi:DEKNAAC101698 [Brettanomyces naardenensis]|uniref:Pre-mRNA-splicing factor CWC22 n=1 Tax=Brettanomyces naardenensis TaxID=13370 RepID=A0A448YIU7_BRENA|nr:DEKNAAC101698 [Brettanomyces naardenensis]